MIMVTHEAKRKDELSKSTIFQARHLLFLQRQPEKIKGLLSNIFLFLCILSVIKSLFLYFKLNITFLLS